jgi:adhesin transport system membrane fusion protein
VRRIEQERAAIVSRVDAAKSRVAALDARLASLEISKKNAVAAADERVRMAQQRIRASNDALDATVGAEGTAAIQEKRIKSLEAEGIQSKRAAELAELDALRAKTEVGRARAAVAGARAEELAFKADRIKVESDASAGIADATASRASAMAEIASGQAEISRIDVRLARQRAQEVRAPRDGLLRRILVRAGVELVKGGDPIAILVPDTDDRAVEMWVDGLDVNLVHPGRRVRLAFEGWPALQFSGWPQAMVGTYGGIVAFVDAASEGPEGKFRVVVRPDPADVPWPEADYLRQGMRASGWVLLDRVRLGYELWRQLNDFPPDWPSDAPRPAKNGDKKGGDKK